MKAYNYSDGVYSFEGNVTVEEYGTWVSPWRIDFEHIDLYPVLKDDVGSNAAGVRLVFESDSPWYCINFHEITTEIKIDVVCDGECIKSCILSNQVSRLEFESVGVGKHKYEIWLDQGKKVKVGNVWIDDKSYMGKVRDERIRWIHYGSSISHSIRAESPFNAWPSIAADKMNYHLTNLGFGGNCICEPMMGAVIRDLPADIITLKLGINCIDGKLSSRSFGPNVIGLIQIIREKHKEIPIVIISPIFCAENDREYIHCASGYTLPEMRSELESIVNTLKCYGDKNIYYVDGLKLFGEEHLDYMSDGIHPDAKGQLPLAGRFIANVFDKVAVFPK